MTDDDGAPPPPPGWLNRLDEELLREVLGAQVAWGVRGDLAELGVYLGRSAVVLGDFLQPGETLTVIDLFDADAGDPANADENSVQYPGLSQSAFEAEYLRHHSQLPRVVRGPSETIVQHASHGTHRLVHVDASHLHEHVVADLDAARTLLQPDGLVVLDDIREPHTPGVSAAAWGAVATGGLRPVVLSEHKLYATWGDGERWTESLLEWARSAGWPHEVQVVAGVELVRLWEPDPEPEPVPEPVRRPLWRRVLRAVAPPALVWAYRRLSPG